MNILVIGKFDTEGFALHISETLESMGHNVKRFILGYQPIDIDTKIIHRVNQVRGMIYNTLDNIPKIRAAHMKKLWQMLKGAQIDVVISCHDFLWANEVQQIKDMTNAKVAMWFPDALVNFRNGHFMNAPYDGLFFKDPYIVKVLGDIVASRIYYLPECFNPQRHCLPSNESVSNIDKRYLCDITTAGNSHSWRVAFYKHLSQYNVKLWGGQIPLWMNAGVVATMHQNKKVFNNDKARAFLGAKIVLNNLHYGEVWGLNVRTFEAAGIGAFQMVDWKAGLAQLFNDGTEIVSFNGLEDMHTKIKYYLEHPDERNKIASAGKLRAMAEHTYQIRLQLLLDTLGGSASGFPLPKNCV